MKFIMSFIADRRGLVAVEQALIVAAAALVILVAVSIAAQRALLSLGEVASAFPVAG